MRVDDRFQDLLFSVRKQDFFIPPHQFRHGSSSRFFPAFLSGGLALNAVEC
jgi:hypothetical protein